jgi:hypothetical protein
MNEIKTGSIVLNNGIKYSVSVMILDQNNDRVNMGGLQLDQELMNRVNDLAKAAASHLPNQTADLKNAFIKKDENLDPIIELEENNTSNKNRYYELHNVKYDQKNGANEFREIEAAIIHTFNLNNNNVYFELKEDSDDETRFVVNLTESSSLVQSDNLLRINTPLSSSPEQTTNPTNHSSKNNHQREKYQNDPTKIDKLTKLLNSFST